MAEVFVHLPVSLLLQDFVVLEISIPDAVSSITVTENELPERWNGFPHHPATQNIGDSFIREAVYGVLQVPSAVVEGDFNYLLDPLHKDFKKIRIVAQHSFLFDHRFFK
jgi:RES domain-containing protein